MQLDCGIGEAERVMEMADSVLSKDLMELHLLLQPVPYALTVCSKKKLLVFHIL